MGAISKADVRPSVRLSVRLSAHSVYGQKCVITTATEQTVDCYVAYFHVNNYNLSNELNSVSILLNILC